MHPRSSIYHSLPYYLPLLSSGSTHDPDYALYIDRALYQYLVHCTSPPCTHHTHNSEILPHIIQLLQLA